MSTKESDIEQACVRLAKSAGCVLLKIQAARGWPDRVLLCKKAQVVFVEFKRPGEDLRPLQKFIQATLRSLDFQAEMVNSTEQFKKILADTLQKNGSPTNTSAEQ